MAKKMLRQSENSSSQPPTIGPSAIAAPVIAPQRPIASARSRRSVNTLVSSERVAGNTIAAPTPITARAAISWPGLSSQPARQARQPEHHETREQHPLAPEPVGQAAGSEHRCRKQQVERIHDPLELRIGCVQFAHQTSAARR